MFIYKNYPNFILVLTLILSSCGDPISKQNSPSKTPSDCPGLIKLLDDEKYDDFYQEVSKTNIDATRSCFEHEAQKGVSFNYGVLLNANIASDSNKTLFKPELKHISSFKDVPNVSRCYMNAALYSIANSDFFDDLLVIDKILPEQWSKRDARNLPVANEILRSLREVIYEIRRGQRTSSKRIATLRDRHFNSLEQRLSDKDLLTSLYLELFTSYQFENVIIALADKKANTVNPVLSNVDLKLSKDDVNFTKLRAALEKFHLINSAPAGFGPIGTLICTLASNNDLIYLDAIFSILDPWGAIARYLSFALYKSGNENKVPYKGPYASTIKLDSKEKDNIKYEIFYDDPTVTNIGLTMRALRNPSTKAVRGKVIYQHEDNVKRGQKRADAGFKLIAKTKHSTNHLIAELFNFSRNEWETHNFFGPPTFSKDLSSSTGTYEDNLSFYEALRDLGQ